MDIAAQLLTLGGVALGALTSYLGASLTERARNRRDVSARWEERRFEAYATYVGDVKDQVVVANRISATLGFHSRVTSPLGQEEGLPLLAEMTARRSVSSERAELLANSAVLDAIRMLSDAAWLMECYARGLVKGASTDQWEADFVAYQAALVEFRRCVRAEIGIPGRFAVQGQERHPSKPLGGLLEADSPTD